MPPDMQPTNPYIVSFLRGVQYAPLLSILIGAMFLDYTSGMIAAWKTKVLNSKTGFNGAMKKAAMLIVVSLAWLMELAVQNSLPESMQSGLKIPVAHLCAGFFLLYEALSILENSGRCGVPLPEFLTSALNKTFNTFTTKVHTEGEKLTIEVRKEPRPSDLFPPIKTASNPVTDHNVVVTREVTTSDSSILNDPPKV